MAMIDLSFLKEKKKKKKKSKDGLLPLKQGPSPLMSEGINAIM